MSAPAGVAVRVLAARILDAVAHRGRSLKAELAAALPGMQDPRDRALTEAICFAALRRRVAYQQVLRDWLQKPLGRGEGELQALLWVGLAQIDALQLAPHAALSATVEATRVLNRPHQAGLVNAILRRAQREGVPAGDAAQAWPDELREQVIRDWGVQAQAIFAASVQVAPLWLRVNRQRGTVAAYLERLHQAVPGIQAQACVHAVDAIRVDTPVAVSALPGFAEGEVSIQDGAAQLVADALLPASRARVLDACAAPGGKTAHLLERVPDLNLLALDVDKRRLQRVHDTLTRVGVRARLQAGDAADPSLWWDRHAFDAVLLDAPCSATGIVRRQPDVLLHRRAADIAALRALQARLLDAVWTVLCPGGVLLYATCSVLKDENEHQIAAFLQRTPDAVVEPLDARWGQVAGAGRQRLPGEAGMDGFFYARLRRAGGV